MEVLSQQWRETLKQACEGEAPQAATNEQKRAFHALAHLAKVYTNLTRSAGMDLLAQIQQDRPGASSTVQNIALRHGWEP